MNVDCILVELAERQPALSECLPAVQHAYRLLVETFISGGKLLVCGNGGSAADAEHIVGELMKSFRLPRRLPALLCQELDSRYPASSGYLHSRLQGGLPAISLSSHSALLTAVANDIAADLVFAQQVIGYGQPGDALLGISTSGNSKNVVYALQVARCLGLRTLGLTGREVAAMSACCDALIQAPAVETALVQEYHVSIYHALCAMLEERFFSKDDVLSR